ncbi:GMC oxidoreductase-domain-containing protein [Leucosporidium creatinivorum]|uniref:GMC oxidoreductase-domain-containing protein n=1 Tax=Leucosporidium creatinivorum TaxID=106004 RepID=A0A1Y2EQ20_9BASI|nr:GMC oxidoreductase-domain-containing protein [Leucosporidium creatinivorum]
MRSFLAAAALLAATGAEALNVHGYVDANLNASLVPEVLAQSYSYIVVGGGNTGAALAARLSEDTTKTVLLVEAGTSQISNPGVSVPGLAGSTFLSEVDWAFSTTPQANAQGRSVYWPRGKMIGGSSGLNFLAYTRGHKSEYNSIAWLSRDASWSWRNLLPYFKKSESFSTPGPNTENVTREFDASVHGTSGPVAVSYPPYISEQFAGGFFDGLEQEGVPVDIDLSDGASSGVSWSASTQSPENVRQTSDNAYIAPAVSARSNLVVLTSAMATKITWSADKLNGSVVASGINLVATASNTTILTATASSEVILSAGSIQTPQLLELSGVGDSSILNPLGISTVVNLPGVGANLQDHPAIVLVQKLKPGFVTLDGLAGDRLNQALADYAAGSGILTQELSTLAYLTGKQFLTPAEQKQLAKLVLQPSTQLPASQQAQQLLQIAAGAPIIEFLPINTYFGPSAGVANESYISLAACLQHSFSRGSIHISTTNPLTPPAIDAAYLQHPADRYILSRAGKFLRQLAVNSTLTSFVESENEPGLSVETDAEWESWVEGAVRTEYHPVGTAAMSLQNESGVVNSHLQVYGTANVRVADLSILPVHVSAHPQSLAYAIAEKAADLILG